MAEPAHVRRIGLYPGTFDPVTNGHLDVIARAARLLDRLVVGVAVNTGKGPLFTLEERVGLVKAEIERIASKNSMEIEVLPFDTLLIDFARKVGASMIVRGLRAVSDFDYERIAKDIREVVTDPTIAARLEQTGQVVNPGTPAEFTAALDDQRATVAKIGKTLGLTPAN